MNSSGKDPVKSNTELDYAPPWARESAREPTRPVLGEPVALPAEKRAENKLVGWANRNSGDDRAWQQRALDPELVPEPPAGVSNVWPTMLRLGIVCSIAAIVAAAVVLLFNLKQSVHHTAQVNVQPSSLTADNGALPLVDSVRIVPSSIERRHRKRLHKLSSRRHPRRRSHRFQRRTNRRQISRRHRHQR